MFAILSLSLAVAIPPEPPVVGGTGHDGARVERPAVPVRDRIKVGMTFEQVNRLLPLTETGHVCTASANWLTIDYYGHKVTVTIVGGKVTSVTKAP